MLILDVLSSMDSISEASQKDIEEDFVSVYFGDSSGLAREESVMEVVKTFYLKSAPQVSPVDVLGFLSNAYSEHDFHDSGNWAQDCLPDYNYKDFFSPVSGTLTSAYGFRPLRKRNHYGIDIAVKMFHPVKSALPGVVTKIGYESAGYGHYVVVAHAGDMETVYAHLYKPLAFEGQSINAGDILGLAGSSGNSTGAHLHFETRYRGKPVNPVSWFNLNL